MRKTFQIEHCEQMFIGDQRYEGVVETDAIDLVSMEIQNTDQLEVSDHNYEVSCNTDSLDVLILLKFYSEIISVYLFIKALVDY